MADRTMDLKGIKCPMPVIKLSKVLKDEMRLGQIVEIEADDCAFKGDVEAYCQKVGHEIISSAREGSVFKVSIKKSV